MRTHGFRLYAIVSMLALLFGSQLCMLVQCSPKRATAVVHGCCDRSAASSAARQAPDAPASHDSAKPCCIQLTVESAPSLEPPVANDSRSSRDSHVPAALLIAAQLVTAPRAALPSSPPRDDVSPHPAPLLSAAGSRAPPLA
jgi:hypothetical protein